jgi:hypothetical protein
MLPWNAQRALRIFALAWTSSTSMAMTKRNETGWRGLSAGTDALAHARRQRSRTRICIVQPVLSTSFAWGAGWRAGEI